MNPKNVGELEDADGIGVAENREAGGKAVFYIKVKDNIIKDIKYKILGCPSAISSASLISVSFVDKSVEEASIVDKNFLIKNLGNLPDDVLECANLSIIAFINSINNYKLGGNYGN